MIGVVAWWVVSYIRDNKKFWVVGFAYNPGMGDAFGLIDVTHSLILVWNLANHCILQKSVTLTSKVLVDIQREEKKKYEILKKYLKQ